jgi:dipeptidyl aminopeptidase/acylaminoacyl peptidase
MKANHTDLISRSVLFGNPDRAALKLSADGGRLAFLAPVEGVLNVWVGPADDLAAAKPVTEDKERGIRIYFWAYTNEHILYLQDKAGDENWRVYVTDLGTGKTRDLTPFDAVQAQINKVRPEFPDEILVGLNKRDARFHDIHRINIRTGEMTLVEENLEFLGYLIDDDYNIRFAERFTDDGGLELLQRTDEGEYESYLKISLEDTLTTGAIAFDKAGTSLYLRDSRGRNTAALTLLDLATGERRILAQDPRSDVGNVMRHPTEKHMQAVTFEYKRREWVVLDDAIAGDFKYLKDVAEGEFSVVSRTLDDKYWVVSYFTDNAPTRYYRYDREAREAHFLCTTRKVLEGLPLTKMYPLVIRSRGGLDLVSYLTLPAGSNPAGEPRPDRALPMVLFVHGGPWGRDRWGFNSAHQWLANRGYAVLSVNFRGSTGFGKAFVNAGDKEWAGKMHDDLIDAVDWAIKEGIADPERIAIMGGSYGGYATLVGMTFTPEKFACGVDIVGPSNLVTLLKSIPPYWTPAIESFTTRVGDHRTDEGRKLLEERSPLNYAHRICRPLLIGQGANDPRVKQAESDQIVSAMKEKDIPVSYVLYGDEGHGFARPENRLSFYAVAEAFLAQHLGGRFQPVGEDFSGSSIQILAGREHVAGPGTS